MIQDFFNQYFSFVKRYLPSKPEQSSIGLDIGSRSCKAVETVRLKNGFYVRAVRFYAGSTGACSG